MSPKWVRTMPYLETKDYALVVGIDDYPRFGENGRNLSGAIRDAKLVSLTNFIRDFDSKLYERMEAEVTRKIEEGED